MQGELGVEVITLEAGQNRRSIITQSRKCLKHATAVVTIDLARLL